MKKCKKILSIFLALLMLTASVPFAFANDEPCPHNTLCYWAEGDAYDYDRDYMCIEHWECWDCGRLFADAAGEQELTHDEVYSLRCSHSRLEHFAEGDHFSYSNSLWCIEYWNCETCGRYFADADATRELTYDEVYSISCQHSNVEFFAAGANSDYYGNPCIDHWECSACGRYFADANATQELTHDEVYPCPHSDLTHYAAGAISNYNDILCIEFWYCPSCSKYFADEGATQELTYNEVFPCQHQNLYHYAEGEMESDGYLCVEHWYCPSCSKRFADEEATQELSYDQVYSIPCPHSNLEYIAEGERSNNDGYINVEFWMCNGCYKYFADEAAQQELTYEQVYSIPCPHTDVYHYEEKTPFCGGTGKREYWTCTKCWKYFADEAATQPLTYDQLTITSPYSQHNFQYEVGFSDEGNGHKWLGTTSYMEESYQEEFGMTVAQKFASEGYSAWNCTNCGVVVKDANGEEMRVGDLGNLSLFVNPIPELAGTVKLPTSPAGLAAGEKWMAYGNYYNAVYSLIPQGEYGLMMLVFTLAMLTMCDFYYNETTQELYMLSYDGDVQNFPVDMLRTVGDEESTKVIPTSSEGLAAGEKWFDAASFYQDAITNFVPDEDLARAEFEAFISSIAAAEFSLSADGSTVYAKGRNAEIAALLEEQGAPTDELAEIMNGGNWFLPLNTFLQSEIMEGNGISILNYVKTVEGGECAHVWNNGVKTKDPTCTQAGIMTYTCTNGCGATREEIIPALGHAWDGGVMNPQPTMTDTGVCTYTCTRCGTPKTVTVSKLDPTPLLNELETKQDLKDNADDASVFFDADANLPADTVFDYEIIAQSKYLQIFDLTLTSGGKEIEPEAPVWVKLPIPKGWNPNWITVWHGNEKLPSFADGGYIYFLTTHFSEFQVKYEEENQEENKPDNSGSNDNTNNQPSGKACKYCGEVHEGFFQKIIGFFHSILALFGLKKK